MSAYKVPADAPKNDSPQDDPKTDPKSGPKSDPESEPKAEPKAVPKSEPKAEPEAEPKADPETEPKADPKSDPKSDPEADPKTEGPTDDPKTGGVEVEGAVDPNGGGPLADPGAHNDYWRDFDNWALFNAPPDVRAAVGQFIGLGGLWRSFARDAANEAAWDSAIREVAAVDAITLLGTMQRQTVQAHYGAPVQLLTLLDSYERFGDDSLPDDPLRPLAPRHNMDGAGQWGLWSAFPDACVRLGIAPDYWLGHGRAILIGALNDGLFRGRFTVNGFSADAAGKAAIRAHVRSVPDGDLLAELAVRYVDSGL